MLQHKCNINVHPITGPNPSQIWFSAHLLRSPWTTHCVPLFVFSINEASVWKSHQNNSSMVRSRGASRKPLCIFSEDLPMSAFYTHGTYLLGAGAQLGNASAAPPGQPKSMAQRWLCPQPPPRDAGPPVGWPGRATGLSGLWKFSQAWPELTLLLLQPPVCPGPDPSLLSSSRCLRAQRRLPGHLGGTLYSPAM